MAEAITPSRHEKSLGLLTTKFVSLLQTAKDGVLDLKVAADTLAVRQKRRIYDITNVLEGIGLIEKKSKNSIQWKGAGPGANTAEQSSRLAFLKQEIDELTRREQELDTHKQRVQQSIKNVTEDVSNHHLAYVTHDDICHCFNGDTMLAIQAPSGTQLEVPVPEGPPNAKKRYQIHLKSQAGPIYVLLVNKDDASSSPVVVQVPPPQDENIGPEFTDPPMPHRTVKVEPEMTPEKSYNGRPLSAYQPSAISGMDTSLSPQRMQTRYSPHRQDPHFGHPSLLTEASHIEPSSLDPLRDMPADMLFDPARGKQIDTSMEGELIDELMSSEAFAPLLRLSPPPSDRDYYFNLDDSEGVCDLFDVAPLYP